MLAFTNIVVGFFFSEWEMTGRWMNWIETRQSKLFQNSFFRPELEAKILVHRGISTVRSWWDWVNSRFISNHTMYKYIQTREIKSYT